MTCMQPPRWVYPCVDHACLVAWVGNSRVVCNRVCYSSLLGGENSQHSYRDIYSIISLWHSQWRSQEEAKGGSSPPLLKSWNTVGIAQNRGDKYMGGSPWNISEIKLFIRVYFHSGTWCIIHLTRSFLAQQSFNRLLYFYCTLQAKFIAEVPSNVFQRGSVAQWLALATLAFNAVGSRLAERSQFFLCPVAIPEDCARF